MHSTCRRVGHGLHSIGARDPDLCRTTSLHRPRPGRIPLHNELRANNLFPSIDAPAFSQPGGEVTAAFGLTLSASGGVIYFTLDGTDPHLAGGGVDPAAETFTGAPIFFTQNPTTVKARVRNGSEWSALQEAVFLVDTEAARAGNLAVAEIHYNPEGSDESSKDV